MPAMRNTTTTCPYCGHQESEEIGIRVMPFDRGRFYSKDKDGKQQDLQHTGDQKCDKCEKTFRYRLVAQPVVETSKLEWEQSNA